MYKNVSETLEMFLNQMVIIIFSKTLSEIQGNIESGWLTVKQ